MISSFFMSKKWALWAYGGLTLIIISLIYQTKLQVNINDWYKEFYDVLENATKHEIAEFWGMILQFLFIAMPFVIVNMATIFFASHWVFRWREALTFAYLNKWRACEKDIEGSSQRMQEDIYRFAKINESLGLQLLRAIMILVAFIPVLWELSKNVKIEHIQDLPGSLVWIALLISIGGLVVSWFVGIKLPKLEYDIQKTEAAFRKELVLAEDDKVRYASETSIIELFTGLKFSFGRLFLHYGYFNVWLISFSQFMVIVPFVLMGPGLFSGAITLGVLMQVSNAFDQVRGGFSVFIDNWTMITELRSIHKRLSEFEKNIGFRARTRA